MIFYTPPIHVVFALLPGSLVLDWAGPAEALRIANQALLAQGLPAPFVLYFASPAPDAETSVGVQLTRLTALPQQLPTPAWLVLVGQPGNPINVTSEATRAAALAARPAPENRATGSGHGVRRCGTGSARRLVKKQASDHSPPSSARAANY